MAPPALLRPALALALGLADFAILGTLDCAFHPFGTLAKTATIYVNAYYNTA